MLASIAAGIFAGALAALLASTLLCAAALAFHWKTLGADFRALFACVIFYLLSVFFIAARFLSGSFSFTLLPFAALAFSALLLAFRLVVYNKSGNGVVVGSKGSLMLVDVFPSMWHSLSGVQVFESNRPFPEGAKVRLSFQSGLFSPPRISSACVE